MTHEVIVSPQIHQTDLLIEQTESKPLYLREDDKRGKKQALDQETVEFMNDQAFGNEEPSITHVTQVLSMYVTPEYKNMVPDRKFYLDQIHYNSVHGAEHAGFVGAYVELTGQAFDLTPRQIELLKMVAYTHDFFRYRDDHPDTGHGDRASKWYLESTSSREFRSKFSDKENSLIVEVARYHDLPWEQVLAEVDSENLTMHMAFRLADALERYRIDKEEWQPQAARMHFPASVDPEALLLFAKKVSIHGRLRRFREGLSIEEALKQELLIAGLVKSSQERKEQSTQYVLSPGEEVSV